MLTICHKKVKFDNECRCNFLRLMSIANIKLRENALPTLQIPYRHMKNKPTSYFMTIVCKQLSHLRFNAFQPLNVNVNF